MTESERTEAVQTLEHEIAMLLRRVRRGIAERAGLVHADLNPTSYSLLLTLVDHGPRRARELAEMFALDKGAVSRVRRRRYIRAAPAAHGTAARRQWCLLLRPR